MSLHSQAKSTNKNFQHSLKTTAPATKIWQIWTTVEKWHLWDVGLKSATLTGAFAVGNSGTIESLKGQITPFTITELTAGEKYTIETKLPFGKLCITRFLEENENTTIFIHHVYFEGISAGLFAAILGKKFRKLLPEAMENIKQLAEE